MEHHPLLRSFEYSILHSEDNNSPHYFLQREDRRSSPLPLVNVRIDFEHGNFFLEGSWMFMTASNKKVRKRREAGKQEWVRVESALYPSLPLDLTDEKSENYHFSLHGIVQDDVILDSCSGKLTVEQIKYTDGGATGEWMLTFYLYNIVENGCDMKFNLLLFPEQHDGVLN
ncbi:MAG TPA: hypothetical protein VF939_21695 [Puia sp.]